MMSTVHDRNVEALAVALLILPSFTITLLVMLFNLVRAAP
jgi:hypothetical protein